MTTSPDPSQDAARLRQAAFASTRAANDQSNKALLSCQPASHEKAATMHRAAQAANQSAYDAQLALPDRDDDLVDTLRNQVTEHSRLSQHHDKEAKEWASKSSGMVESPATRLATMSRRASAWSTLARATGRADDFLFAASCNAIVVDAAHAAGETRLRDKHAVEAAFHQQQVSRRVLLSLNAGGKPPGCEYTDFLENGGALQA